MKDENNNGPRFIYPVYPVNPNELRMYFGAVANDSRPSKQVLEVQVCILPILVGWLVFDLGIFLFVYTSKCLLGLYSIQFYSHQESNYMEQIVCCIKLNHYFFKNLYVVNNAEVLDVYIISWIVLLTKSNKFVNWMEKSF